MSWELVILGVAGIVVVLAIVGKRRGQSDTPHINLGPDSSEKPKSGPRRVA